MVFTDYIPILMVVLGTLIILATNSYLMFGLLAILMLGMPVQYGGGFLAILLSIVYLLIIARFVRQKKRYLREQKQLYQEGQESARKSKVFNRGFNDEYYRE